MKRYHLCKRRLWSRSGESWLPQTLLALFVLLLLLLLLVSSSSYIQALLHLNDRAAVRTRLSRRDAQLLNSSFTDLIRAYRLWDEEVGCAQFKQSRGGSTTHGLLDPLPPANSSACGSLLSKHVTVLVKKWRWLPKNLENLYSCECGLTCLWTKSQVLAGGSPDALLYETASPPYKRVKGEPLRVYMDLEPGRKATGYEDIFISYHADDTVQATYAGSSFHVHRSYFTSAMKRNDVLVYWSSSHCVPARTVLAKKLLSYLPHHSFGKCCNNMGGEGAILGMYKKCSGSAGNKYYWAYHLHCAMSHYKFVLAIENTMTESYVTEKLFYALDAGTVPIYFGAPNVGDMVPPHSIIDGSKFSTLENLADYVKRVAADPVLYAEYHAWRRCGVMGSYHHTRAVSLDSLPCRLCSEVSKRGGRSYEA